MSTLTGRIPLDANRFPVLAGLSTSDGVTVTTVYVNPTSHALLTSSGTGSSSNQVQGTAADNAAAVGNPVRTGAKYNSSTQTYADGDVADTQADVNGNTKVTLATAIDEDIDSITAYDKAYTYTSIAADGVVSAVPVALCGYYVSASSTGVISIFDNASTNSGTTVLATSKSVAANDLVLLETPIAMVNGVYFDLISGTATVLVLTRKITSQ